MRCDSWGDPVAHQLYNRKCVYQTTCGITEFVQTLLSGVSSMTKAAYMSLREKKTWMSSYDDKFARMHARLIADGFNHIHDALSSALHCNPGMMHSRKHPMTCSSCGTDRFHHLGCTKDRGDYQTYLRQLAMNDGTICMSAYQLLTSYPYLHSLKLQCAEYNLTIPEKQMMQKDNGRYRTWCVFGMALYHTNE